MTAPLGGGFTIAEGVLVIDANTDAADRQVDGFFRDIDGKLRNARVRFAKEGEESGREYGEGLDRGLGRSGGFFSRLFRGIGSGISSGIGQLRELGSTLRDVGQVASTAGGIIGGFLKIGGLLTLIPIIIAVAAALSKLIGLLGLLPGVIGFAVAAIAPLIVGFKGVGEAIGALVSGDMQKFNEALKKLAPSARAFVKEFGQILPMLRTIKRDTQQALFAPLVGGLRDIGRFLLPTIRIGMASVAGALGRMMRGFMDLLAANDIVETIGDLFESTGRIIDRVGPSMIRLFGTLFGIMEHSLPFVERMFTGLANAMDRFSGFLGRAMQSGDFEKWLEGAFSVMRDLWELTKALVGLLGALFGPTADEGQTFIQSLTKMTRELEAFFRSAEGVRFLEDLVAIVRNSGPILHAFAVIIIGLARANNAFVDAIAATVRWFRELDDVIGGWLSGAGNAISGWWDSAVDAIGRLGTAIGTFVVEKAAAFGRWLADLPGMIYNGLVRAAELIGFAIGHLIGTAVRTVLELPGKIAGGLEALKMMVIAGLETITQYVIGLPGRWATALSNLWSTVTSWFRSTKDSAVGNTRSMVDQSVAWVQGLGPRIRTAIGNATTWLREAGRDAIRGLIEGFKDMLGWAYDRVRGFASEIVRGFKRGLEARSPSQLMRREVGRTILPGVVQGMQDTMGSLERFMGTVSRQIAQPLVNVSPPAVSVSGPSLLVDLGDGVQRAMRTVVARNPEVVAAGTDEGRRRRIRELGARAKA